MTPAINVNLRPCRCPVPSGSRQHMADGCAAAPLLIPCPIPRSATFEVRLGECVSGCGLVLVESGLPHAEWCPARPIKVSCSISGTTWAASEVTACDVSDAFTGSHELDAAQHPVALAACRERWALVKALVLGRKPEPYESEPEASLIAQRDAVFVRLANMAQAEQAEFREWLSLPDEVKRKCQTDPPDIEHERTPAVESLAAYVEHLIEQVGVLP